MTLAQIQKNVPCKVLSAASEASETQSRLYALGIFPGVELVVLRFAPMGDPLQVKVGHTLLSIRKQEAESIEVMPVDERVST